MIGKSFFFEILFPNLLPWRRFSRDLVKPNKTAKILTMKNNKS